MSVATADFAGLEAALEQKRLVVEAALRRLVPDGESQPVARAVAASLLAPAKRLRPIVALLVAEVLSGDPEEVLAPACAVELVHTASLILDDLPCMDDASARRGQPACHVAHGEATAILAAFALLNRAYELIADEAWAAPGDVRLAVTRELAKAVGTSGMIAGQAMDLEMTDRRVDLETLEFIHSRKTGALFMAAAAIGAHGGRATPSQRAAIVAYAKNLGLAFQIVDDVLDTTAAPGESGKDVGQDLRKTTFVSFAGAAGARQLAQELVRASQEALAPFGAHARRLRELADYVVSRRR